MTPPTLISLVRGHFRSITALENFTYFLQKTSEKVGFESIWKPTQLFFARCLTILVEEEQPFEALHNQQAEVFVSQALKMRDGQLRKIVIDYVRWAAERIDCDNHMRLHFGSRKGLLLKMFERLSDKLGDLFTHFFGYIFDDMVEDIKTLTVMAEPKATPTNPNSNPKRQHPLPTQYSLQLCAAYTQQLLLTLRSLFVHDHTSDFLDSLKFDAVAPQLAAVFVTVNFDEHYSEVIGKGLLPCLVALCVHTADDYKLKTLNTHVRAPIM
jgi:hypothetical protein